MWGNIATIAVALIGTLILGITVVVILNWIRDSVASWLRNNNLEYSHLMNALIVFDNVDSKVRAKLFVKTYQTGTQQIDEELFSPEQLKEEDPEAYAEYQKSGHAEKNVMSQIT